MAFAVFKIIGSFLFLYLIWRNLRDNYDSDDLVNYGWVALLGFLVGSRLVYGLINWGIFENWWEWFLIWRVSGSSIVGGYLGFLLTTWFISKNKLWKVWPFFEDVIKYFLVFLSFWQIDELVRGGVSELNTAILLLSVLFFVWLVLFKQKYRSLVWYKSGKKGFNFFAVNLLLLLLLGVWISLRMSLIWGFLLIGVSLIFGIGLIILGEVYAKR